METISSREVYSNPWISVREDEIQRRRFFLATDLTLGEHEREVEEQDMRAEWFSRDDVEAMIRGGTIVDADTVAAYALLLLHERNGG